MKRSLSVTSLSMATLIALSACGSSSGANEEGLGENSSVTAAPSDTAATGAGTGAGGESTSNASAQASAEYNDSDVMFAQMMIPHHNQAVEMSEMMLAKDGISPEITDLAVQIKDAQGPEIETMTDWLETWGQPLEPMDSMEGHDMSSMGGDESMEGMLSEHDMAELESAEDVEASRMFLESMTAHHVGAIDMAQVEIDNGKNPDAIELAEMIIETQNAEITLMNELLAGL